MLIVTPAGGAAGLASLPMYDRPETAAAHDALWSAIRDAMRAEGIAAPDALDRSIGLWAGWENPALVLGQTCSLPYRTRLHGRVTLVGAFDHALPGLAPGTYCSVLIARTDDRRPPAEIARSRFVMNQPHSQSGWAAPFFWAAAQGLALTPAMESGGHRASAQAVAGGDGDWAALDAVTWRGIERWEPALAARVRVFARTAPSPALPLIAAAGVDAARHARAVAAGVAALSAADRATLGIAGFVATDAAGYLALPVPPAP